MKNKKRYKDFMKIGTVALMSAGMVTAVSQTASAQIAPAGKRMAPRGAVAPAKIVTLDRTNLGKLGNNLFASAAERQKFLANPTAYTEMLFGAKISPASSATLNNIKVMLSDGFCCAGCGCGSTLIPVGQTMRR